MEQRSFKSRVRETVIKEAVSYMEHFSKYDYLICSEGFKNHYYIISAHEDNFMHLTGVASKLNGQDFFKKCVAGSLSEEDFSFHKNGVSEKSVKGSVREKICVIHAMHSIFSLTTLVEENFEKNTLKCTFAAGNTICTLGFINNQTARPMTLLKGQQLHAKKSKQLELVLRKNKDEELFSEIIAVDDGALEKYRPFIKNLIADVCQ